MSDDAARAKGPQEVQRITSDVVQLRTRHARLMAASAVLLHNPALAAPQALDSACDYCLSFGAGEIRERIARILPMSRELAESFVLALVHASALNGDTMGVDEYLDADVALACGFGSLDFVRRVQSALCGFQRTIHDLVGTSPAIAAIRSRLWTLCFGDDLSELERFETALRTRHVLVIGEAGTGHELVSAVIVASSLGGDLLVLKEVTELSAGCQSELVGKLARGEPLPRIVAATAQSLSEHVAAGTFQHALCTRLCQEYLVLPSLRERPGDIALLGTHLAEKLLEGSVLSMRPLVRAIAHWLERSSHELWPGNLPELEAAVRHFVENRRSGEP